MSKIFLTELGIVSSLGQGKTATWQRLFTPPINPDDPQSDTMTVEHHWLPEKQATVGKVSGIADYAGLDAGYSDDTGFGRCALLVKLAYQQISTAIEHAKTQYGANRIAIILGTSTAGTGEAESAFSHLHHQGQLPTNYDYSKQEMNGPSRYLAQLAGVTGPVYSISTACSSGAKALISGAKLIKAGIVDAVICGGADSLCKLTLNGFDCLESLSPNLTNPMSKNRQGINIGEGAALFLMQKGTEDQTGICLSGYGESSDAHHVSAPHPQGDGAFAAMSAAINMAELNATQLDYINLHGTATVKNDQMEALAIERLGASDIPCSSTKSLTGHTLAGAGAIEAGLCWLAMNQAHQQLPPHYFDGEYDQQIAQVQLVSNDYLHPKAIHHCLSNSFAFGGSNVSLVLSVNTTEES